jgi:glutamate dehydrogenase/leucine dehydrogenase
MAGGVTDTSEQLQQISDQLTWNSSDVDSILTQLASVAQAQFEEPWAQGQIDAAGLHQAFERVARLAASASPTHRSIKLSMASSSVLG